MWTGSRAASRGVLLVCSPQPSLDLGVKGISVVVMVLCVPWMYFSYLARREYVATIRKRFEARRLDLESARISVQDDATIRFLESVVEGDNPRQAVYALTLLADAPGYDARPIVAQGRCEPASRSSRTSVSHGDRLALRRAERSRGRRTPAAIAYVLDLLGPTGEDRPRAPERPGPRDRRRRPSKPFATDRELAQELITREWLQRMTESARSEMPGGRRHRDRRTRRPGHRGASPAARGSRPGGRSRRGARGRNAQESRATCSP